MPFHIFLSQSLSLVTGGLDAWKIGKDVAIAVLTLFTICLVFWQGRKGETPGLRTFTWIVGATFVYGMLHLTLWALHGDLYRDSAMLGTIYNMRLPALVIIGYGAYLAAPTKFVFSTLLKILLTLSTIVVVLGIVQYLLPKDILTHFGYGFERGARPAFFIDNHPELPRIMSTLREPNALAAYLLVPVAVLTSLLLRIRDTGRRYILGGLAGLHLLAIFLTQSRSGWLATALVIGLLVLWQYGTQILRLTRRYWYMGIAGLILIGGVGWSLQGTTFFQQYIVHSNPEETAQDLDSNELHWLLVKEGLEGAAQEPFGHGPGTAGLASIQNPAGGQLTENYYVQLAYEIGLAGAAVFIAANMWLYIRLWRRGDEFGRILCASFWGYVLTNMLLHTWSNEAVATQWWLLAGLAIIMPTSQHIVSAKRS